MTAKLSVITDEFGDPDFEKIAAFVAAQGYEHVELRNVWIKNVFNLDDIDIGEIKDILAANALKVSSISGGLMKTKWPGPPDEQETMEDGTPIVEHQLRMADNCIKVADVLGVKYIRAFGFHRISMFEEEMWPDWFDAMKALVKKAEARDKIVIVENEHGCTVSDAASIRRAFAELAGPHCKLLFDPGNLLAAGEYVTDEVFDLVKDITAYIHVKDAKVLSENPMSTSWCIIGEGNVGWKDIADRFTGHGYDSFWSVETHMGKTNAWDNTARNLAALRELLE